MDEDAKLRIIIEALQFEATEARVAALKTKMDELGLAFDSAGKMIDGVTGKQIKHAEATRVANEAINEAKLAAAQASVSIEKYTASIAKNAAALGILANAEAEFAAKVAESVGVRIEASGALISEMQLQIAVMHELDASFVASEMATKGELAALMRLEAAMQAQVTASSQVELAESARLAAIEATAAGAASASELTRIAVEAEALAYPRRNAEIATANAEMLAESNATNAAMLGATASRQAKEIDLLNAANATRLAQLASRQDQEFVIEAAADARRLAVKEQNIAAEMSQIESRLAQKAAIQDLEFAMEAEADAKLAAPRIAAERAIQSEIMRTAVIEQQKLLAIELSADAEAASVVATNARAIAEMAATMSAIDMATVITLETEALEAEAVAATAATAATAALTLAKKIEEAETVKATASHLGLSKILLGTGYASMAAGGFIKGAGIEAELATHLMEHFGFTAVEAGRAVRYFGVGAGGATSSVSGLGAETGLLSGVLGSLLNPAALMTAAIVGIGVAGLASAVALKHMATDAGEFGEKLFVARAESGLTVNNLLALEVAAKSTGSTIEQLETSLRQMFRRAVESEGGTSRLAKGIQKLGFDTQDSNKMLSQFLSYLYQFPAGAERIAAAQAIAGRSGGKWAEITELMKGNLDAFTESLGKMGISLGDNAVDAAQKFNVEAAKMNMQWDVMKFKIESSAFPIVIQWFKEISEWMVRNEAAIIDWGNTFVSVLGTIVEAMGPVMDALGGLIAEQRNAVRFVKENAQQGVQSGQTINPLTGAIEGKHEENYADAGEYVSPGSSEPHGTHPGRLLDPKVKAGGHKGEAERASKAELAIARIDLKILENFYADLLDKEKAYYELGIITAKQYTADRVSEENDRYAKQLDVFRKSQDEIDKGALKETQRKVAQKKQDEEEQAALLKHTTNIRHIETETTLQGRAEAQRIADAGIAMQEQTLQTLEQGLKNSVNARKAFAVEAEEQRWEAVTAINAEQVANAERLLDEIPNHETELYKRRLDNLNVLNEQIHRSTLDHNQKMGEARLADLLNVQGYAKDLEEIQFTVRDLIRETQEAQLESLRDNTFYESKLRNGEAKIAKEAEADRSQRAIVELGRRKEELKAEVEAQKLNAFEALKQMKALDQEIIAEKSLTVAKQAQIEERARHEATLRARETANDISGIILSGMHDGWKGFFDSLKSFLNQLEQQLLSSALMKILDPKGQSQGSTAGGLLGSITNIILSKIGLGKSKPVSAGGTGIPSATGDILHEGIHSITGTAATAASTVAISAHTTALTVAAPAFTAHAATIGVATPIFSLHSAAISVMDPILAASTAATISINPVMIAHTAAMVALAKAMVADTASSGASNFAQTFASSFSGSGPGFASGGFIQPGHWGMTGETGPEPIYGGQTGVSVFPSSSLNGGKTHVDKSVTNYNIMLPPNKATSYHPQRSRREAGEQIMSTLRRGVSKR